MRLPVRGERALRGTSGSANDDGYTKGRLLSLGLPSTFTVTAAARVGSDSMAVAGTTASNGHPWVVTVDDDFALAHQSTLPIGGALASTTTGSVAVDATTGNVFVCGTTTSLVFLPFRPPVPHGWIAQQDPNLTSWQVISEPTLIVRGCAVTPQGSIVATGTYSGTFNGQAASGASDMSRRALHPRRRRRGPRPGGVHQRRLDRRRGRRFASVRDGGRQLFVAGITQGNWGAASGSSPAKVFVARFDPVTLALY